MTNGLILAAGRGSRLGELTADLPKCMVQLCGESMLSWQVAAMREGGIETLRIVTGYRGESIPFPKLHVANSKWSETNMVRSLFAVGDAIPCPIVVSYSDIVYSPSAIRSLVNISDDLAITYDPNWLAMWTARFSYPLDDAETFAVDVNDIVTDIGRRTSSLSEIGGQFMGLVRIGPRSWNRLAEMVSKLDSADADRMDTTKLLAMAIKAGMKVRGVPYRGPWAEVDSMSDLSLYQADPRFNDLRAMLESLRSHCSRQSARNFDE